MDAFVLRIAARPGAALTPDTPRLARMVRAGWRSDQVTLATQSALSGRAALGQSGPWKAIGLAVLYNAEELRSQDPYAGEGDINLIAHLRATRGTDFHKNLTGGFAVVLIHTETGEIEAYRDHFGMIPFYYCVHDRHLTCSTDIRAALHLSEQPVAENLVRLADFLTEHEIDRDITALYGILRLPAAHRLEWQAGAVRTAAYWSLTLPEKTIQPAEAPERLRMLLERATEGCARAIPDVGAMLSGGLDSSSLTGIAANLQQVRKQGVLPAFSFVYGAGNPMDESPYIDAANAAFATAPHPIPMTTAPRLSGISEVVEEQMDFFLAFGQQKSRNIYRVAAEQGLTALLDGHGGDEVISHGFDRMIELAASRNWGRLFVEMRGVSKIYGRPFLGAYCFFIVSHGGLAPRSVLRRVLNRIARQLLPRKSEYAKADLALDILAPDLRAQIAPETRYVDPVGPQTEADRLCAERTKHLDNLTHPRSEAAFEILHRSASANGILPLYPFFDKRVVEFCLSVPSEAKLKSGLSRWVLREAMRGLLPEKIRTRTTKTDFSDEFRTTVLQHYDREGLESFSNLASYVDTTAVDRLHHILSDPDSQTIDALRLWWRLAVLAHWQTAFTAWQTQQKRGELI